MELAGIVVLALFVVAVVSIVRSAHLGILAKAAWSIVAFVLPIIGPLLWFTVGKKYPYGTDGNPRPAERRHS
ncbi:PLD nuclease N-terminal domain-containing protein [Rhodococcus sp. NBC_00297]|uniref:PLD nuclease N-terminal domain-containing protein n=1 Tax=Rhodococcus sp. NBC_00297 TaxID=2976005 RepID=UPI002E2BC112|nr:PLD nuclease N-terminal domain-containing protein [Rhodococcus sp. NBC_00297]